MDEQLQERFADQTVTGDVIRVPLHNGGDGTAGPPPEFLLAFVRAGSKVADSIATAAQQAGADDPIVPYAQLLSETWAGEERDPSSVTSENLAAAWFTLRSFPKVCEATTPFSRQAKARCQAACEAVSQYFGTEASRIDARIDTEISARHISAIGLNLKGGPGSMDAWRYLAELSAPPVSEGAAPEEEPTGSYRGAEPATPKHVDAAAPDAEAPHLYDVWFGTNRARVDANDASKGFTNERDPAGTVHYGTCSVAIPRTHKFGSTGTPFWKRWIRLEFTDDHLKLRKISPFDSEDDFLGAMREEMEALDEGERSVLVYLHGYNTSFQEAALRAAQIGFDLKVPGATAFYSWPSMAQVKGYGADIARVEASEVQIANFLTAVATRAGASQVHVIAHSMGNRGFARAIARITSHATATSNVRFGQILLAAPDIDVDLFNQLAIAYPKICERATMYVSAKDKALAMSSFLQDSNRAGFTPPVTLMDGIDTIEVTNIDLTILGHGYFAEAAPVLYDIKELIADNKPPDKRLRVRPEGSDDRRYWVIGA